MLRATTACNCSSLIWLDGSAPAALASLLFDPPEPQSIVKTQLCYPFAHLHLLSSDSFFSLIFSLLLFSSLTLPTSAFPSVHIVGSLTSKLPSMIMSPFSVACENPGRGYYIISTWLCRVLIYVGQMEMQIISRHRIKFLSSTAEPKKHS